MKSISLPNGMPWNLIAGQAYLFPFKDALQPFLYVGFQLLMRYRLKENSGIINTSGGLAGLKEGLSIFNSS
jgi:hypothetical protein